MKRILLATLLLLGAPAAYAQTVPTQQVPARADAATQVTTNVTSASTSTLTPQAGQVVAIYEIDVTNCAGSAAVTAAATTSITTTGLTGSPAWLIGSGSTAGACAQVESFTYPTGLKSTTPGGNVTFVMPTFATNQTIRLNVAWASAPPQ